MLKIVKEIELEDFEAWSGGEDTLNHIINEGGVKQLQAIIEEEYPEGLSEEDLNDLLRHESDWCYKMAQVSNPDDEEEEDEDDDEDEEKEEKFNDFCCQFVDCKGCPYENLESVVDCMEKWEADNYLTDEN